MTATTSLDPQAMEFSSLEDKMDLASSPFAHVEEVEDLEFEFDQMDNRPPDPTSDSMMDDATEQSDVREENADVGDVEFFEDENIDEEIEQDANSEFAMAESARQIQDDDEEILYEEEDDPTAIINKPEIENNGYLQNPGRNTEELLVPDETQDHVPSEASEPFDTTTGQAADTNLDGGQSNNSLNAPQDNKETVADDNDTARDDSDGPSVNPTATEYQEDPDSNQPAQATEADLQVEESFEEVLDEDEAISAFPPDCNADESIHLPHTETIQQSRADKEAKAHGDLLVSQEDLHSMRVVYQGVEYSLFPPKGDDSTSYFLADPALATQPLDALLASCREVLGKPEDLDHHDELVLDVPTMGLHICEDSKYASQIKLSDVVEVYLSLNHNEDRQAIEPLYCNLSTRVCLSTQFDWLRDQAKGGSTFSDIAAQHVDSSADENEGADSAPTQEDFGEHPEATDGSAAGGALETQPTSDTVGYPTDGDAPGSHTLQSGAKGPAGGLPGTSSGVEEVIADDRACSEEDLQIESGDTPSTDEGPNSILDPAMAPAPDYGDDLPNAEAVLTDPQSDADAEVSEFFQEAIDEQIEEEGEEVQEATEDQSMLQKAIAQEQVEDQSLLADEAAQDEATENQDSYDADEFLINSDDDVAGEADTGLEDAAAAESHDVSAQGVNGKHTNGNQLTAEGSDTSAIAPTTPSKKTSKRKVGEEEDDFILELDTPEPKRRRPS